jgi:anti-anti-sigma factor
LNVLRTKVISCRGSISAHHARQLRDAINTLTDTPGGKVVIDLSETEFLAHQALVILLSAQDKMNTLGGSFAVCGVNKGIGQMFANASVSSAIRIFPTRAQALQEI